MKFQRWQPVIIFCLFVSYSNGSPLKDVKNSNKLDRSIIQRKLTSQIRNPAISRNHENWKNVVIENTINQKKKNNVVNLSRQNFKRWPLRSPYDVAMDSGPILKYQYLKSKMRESSPIFHSKRKFTDQNVHSRSSIIPCLYVPMGTRKECIESNQQEQNKNIQNNAVKPLDKELKPVSSDENPSHENKKVENNYETQENQEDFNEGHKNKDPKYIGTEEPDSNEYVNRLSPSTKEIAMQKIKEEEAEKILHSGHENINMVSFHKQNTKTENEEEIDEQSSKNRKINASNREKDIEKDEELKEKARNKDKELKMKAMKLRLKDEDNFEDQIKTVENDLKDQNKSEKSKEENEEEHLKFKNRKIEKKLSNEMNTKFKSEEDSGPQSIAEMKDESNPRTENEEKKLQKEMSKSNKNNDYKNDEMQSKLLQNKLKEQTIDHNLKTEQKHDPRPEENTAEVEDALINSQPHKINTENQEKIYRPQQQVAPIVTTNPGHQFNQYTYEHNTDNQFFKLWREDLLIKQKFIERMTNMDTKYLGLLYKISKSLDSISHTLTNGFKVMNSVMGEQLNTADLMDKHYQQQQQQQIVQKPNNGLGYF